MLDISHDHLSHLAFYGSQFFPSIDEVRSKILEIMTQIVTVVIIGAGIGIGLGFLKIL